MKSAMRIAGLLLVACLGEYTRGMRLFADFRKARGLLCVGYSAVQLVRGVGTCAAAARVAAVIRVAVRRYVCTLGDAVRGLVRGLVADSLDFERLGGLRVSEEMRKGFDLVEWRGPIL